MEQINAGNCPVIHIVGARPQFIKLAPVLEALEDLGISSKVVHTGQHYDYSMSGMHFKTLKLRDPDYHLGIAASGNASRIARMIEAVGGALLSERPGLVLVYGDTDSTLAGALSAVKTGIRVGHIEAGVRSFDRNMPEEINRVVTDHISTYHFCPTLNAVGLLAKEGITGTFTGDVMFDALLGFLQTGISQPFSPPFILATIHRAENTNDPKRFRAVWKGLELLSRSTPVIFPAHPRTRNMYPDMVRAQGKSLLVIEPASYFSMLAMIRDACCVVTDSGGVQKEAFLLKTPCVTVRDTTEWPETVEAGANKKVEPDPEKILASVGEMAGFSSFGTENPFGDGRASRRIAEFIRDGLLL